MQRSDLPFSVKGCFLQLLFLYATALTTYMYLQNSQLSLNGSVESREISPAVMMGTVKQSKWDPLNPLALPAGRAQNLPSIRVQEPDVDQKRKIYGGAGDKKHLGGFTVFDDMGVSPATWKYMIERYGVKSLLDVGCGRGISTLWFLKHGVDVLCAEGSHDAVMQSLLPDPENQIVEHDFSRGPWWPDKTYDAVWSVEFLEHVNRQFHFNYITAFRKCALLFVTSSRNGGWHHTEVHMDDWWIRKYESYGFRYSKELTDEIRSVASQERKKGELSLNGQPYNAQHIWLTMKVFINPAVAALPEHAHLFPEHGCYEGRKDGDLVHRECGTGTDSIETPLDKSLYPLVLTPEMDTEWEEIVKKNIQN